MHENTFDHICWENNEIDFLIISNNYTKVQIIKKLLEPKKIFTFTILHSKNQPKLIGKKK